jgi:hypothetical protein
LLTVILYYNRCNKTFILIPLVGLLILLVLFFIGWTIMGGYYTFPLRTNNDTQYENPSLPTYCHPVLYWMSFVILIIYFVVLSVAGIDFVSVICSSD